MAETGTADTGGDHDTLADLSNKDPASPDGPSLDRENAKGDGTPSESASLAGIVQYWVDRALNFFSHASNETLGACFIGLGASTYLVLGRVGLVLMGVVGGIALHATWEGTTTSSDANAGERDARRKELGLDVVNRVFRWRDGQEAGEAHTTVEAHLQNGLLDTRSQSSKTLDYTGFEPETSAALGLFTDAVIRDYVHWWYLPVIPGEETFPSSCRQTFIAFILSLSSHLGRKRPVDIFLDFITNSSSILIVFLNELSAALNASPNSEASKAIETYLQSKPDSSLARMLDVEQRNRKLDLVAEDILQNYLEARAYHFPPARVFLKQVLSKLILAMTIETCSKPEWINEWIVFLLEEGEPEIMQAIDAGVENTAGERSESAEKQAEALETARDVSASLDDATESAHRRQVNRAEEAMDDAMREAKRLTQLIMEEEAKKQDSTQTAGSSGEDVSESDTPGVPTPSSSQSESGRPLEPDTTSSGTSFVPSSTHSEPAATPTADTFKQQFTSFDQMLPDRNPDETDDDEKLPAKPVLTLVNARISIFDDSMPGEKGTIKSKPTIDYLIQIEPAASVFPGWMIARKYTDFEVLHEVLRRISVITGVRFTDVHNSLPLWKSQTKASLRAELERYLADALRYQQLAESEGMKRFLEKEQGMTKSPGSGKGFGWPDPQAFNVMGKGMMDVLTKAPKGVAGGVATGGKAIFGGVNSVLGGKRQSPVPGSRLPRSDSDYQVSDSYAGSISSSRASQESLGPGPREPPRTASRPSVDASSSLHRSSSGSAPKRPLPSSREVSYGRQSMEARQASTLDRTSTDFGHVSHVASSPVPITEPNLAAEETYNLPPPPSLIDDIGIDGNTGSTALARPSVDSTRSSVNRSKANEMAETAPKLPARPVADSITKVKAKSKPRMTEQETQVTVELLFAMITELYTLSSAWNFRRTLLQAAKTFLLRPGNPQLEAIRVLIQDSVIDANSSDAGLAALVLKIRENSLPTEDELKQWPKPPSDKEKEELKVKARHLLVEKGMPQALTSVMGAAASGEALGKVFDCLQDTEVAKSMMFGLMLQALRAVVQ